MSTVSLLGSLADLIFFGMELCAIVTGNKAAPRIIEQLESINLIISVSTEDSRDKSWLRYHPLFIESS